MRVLYDSYSFDREKIGGVTRYFTELIKHLPNMVDPILGVRCSYNHYLHNEPLGIPSASYTFEDFLPRFNFRGKYRLYRFCSKNFTSLFPGQEAVNERYFLSLLRRGDYDIVHLTGCWDGWDLFAERKPFVVTMHDLIPEITQNSKESYRWRRKVLNAATRVIAISENTKRDILERFDCDASKIDVVYHGVTLSPKSCPVEELLGTRYVLYVGKRNAYKNFERFVMALGLLRTTTEEFLLVCTGSEFTSTEKIVLQKNGFGRMSMCRKFSDEELRWLYENAQCFVYPSLYEGFGLPILDAFEAGCPVVLSRASCFPEIAGDAALYFDPHDYRDIAKKLSLLFDSGEKGRKLRMLLREAGRNRAREFSWAKCARETVDVYKKAIDEFSTTHGSGIKR